MTGWLIILGISIICLLVGLLVWHRCLLEDWTPALVAGSVILLIVSALVLIIAPIMVRTEVKEFEYTREMVEQTIDTGAYNHNIMMANKWYVEAKSKKDVYGIFSFYRDIDFDVLQPISYE